MAKTHRIAVVPGDGIGKETVPEALKVLDAASRRFGFGLEFAHYDWSCETYKKTGAMMPAGRHGASGAVRLDPARRGRLARRAGPHLALGPADPDPPRLRPVCQSAALQADARRAHAACQSHRGRHRLLRGAREHRGRIFLGRRTHVRGHRARVRHPAERVHPPRRGPHPEIRLRTRAHAAEEASDVGHQVERHHLHHAVLGRALRADGQGVSRHPHRPVPHRHPVRAFRAASRLVRRGGRLQPVRRHSVATSVPRWRDRSASRHRPTSIRRGNSPRCSNRCTARRPTSRASSSATRSARSGRPG